jgi:hypothetical protein
MVFPLWVLLISIYISEYNYQFPLGDRDHRCAARREAAQPVGRAFGYRPAARMTMWSLTLPQVAATLAATLVAFDTRNPAGQRLIDNRLLKSQRRNATGSYEGRRNHPDAVRVHRDYELVLAIARGGETGWR